MATVTGQADHPNAGIPESSVCETSEALSADSRVTFDWNHAFRVSLRVLLVAFVAFVPVRENLFVDLDDQVNFLENREFRGLGPQQLKWAWTTNLLGVYQPVSWMILEAEYSAWGLNPVGYHFFSLFLHVVNAIALYALTAAILARCVPAGDGGHRRWLLTCAGLATALFAVHPLRTEVVAWASCQPYLPCSILSVLSILCYMRAQEDGRKGASRRVWLLGSLALCLAALLSKAVAVSVPVLLLILDVYPLKRVGWGRGWRDPEARRALLEKVPFFLLSLVFMAVAVRAKDARGSLVSREEVGLSSSIALACHSVWFYPIKTFWPFDLNVFYMRPPVIRWWDPRFGFSVLGVVAVSAALFRLRRRFPAALASWVAYLVIVAPNSGLVVVFTQLAADRYSYCASMAWVALAAAGLYTIGLRGRRAAAATTAAALAAIAMLIGLSMTQAQSWENSMTLWSHALAHGGADNADLHNNVGSVHYTIGDYDEALKELGVALRLNPDHPPAHHNLGLVRLRKGQIPDAVDALARAVTLAPRFLQARADLSFALTRAGRNAEANEQLAEIARLMPDSAKAQEVLGIALLRQGRLDEAESRFFTALEIDPTMAAARNGLAKITATRVRDLVNPDKSGLLRLPAPVLKN
jgi:tetratricopeptide (TPR) repeat protein